MGELPQASRAEGHSNGARSHKLAAASSTGILQLVLQEGKGHACVCKEPGLQELLCSDAVFSNVLLRALPARLNADLTFYFVFPQHNWVEKNLFTAQCLLPQYPSIHTYRANLAHVSLLDTYRPSPPHQEHSKLTCSEHRLLLRH